MTARLAINIFPFPGPRLSILERGNVQGLPCGTTLARVHFCGLAIFRVLQELIIAVRTDWSFLLGITYCDFQKVPNKSLMTFSFLLSAWIEVIFLSNNTVCVARCFTEY